MYRVCRKAGLPERGWHSLRHSFGTHAALFGVNPWRLMSWMGHKRIDETMLYVHVAAVHQRALPQAVVAPPAASPTLTGASSGCSLRGSSCGGKPVAKRLRPTGNR